MKLSVIISVGVFCVLCQAIELNPFGFGRSKSKKTKINIQTNPLEQYRKLPSVYFTMPYFQANARQNKDNLEYNTKLLNSDFDVSPVSKRMGSPAKIESSISDSPLRRYDPNAFNYNDFFSNPHKYNSNPPAGSSRVDVYALPDETDLNLVDFFMQNDTHQESETKYNLLSVQRPKPSNQPPELHSSIQTGGDYENHLQDPYPTKNNAVSFSELVGKIAFGLPLFLGYLRVVTYLNQLCSATTTCGDTTVTSTVTATANSVVTVTASSTLTAFFTFTQTFLFSQTTTFLTISITRSTLTVTTITTSTSVILARTNLPGGTVGLDFDEEENLTFFKPVIQATLVPYVYTTYEVIPITSQVIVSTVMPSIDNPSIRPEQIVYQSKSVLATNRPNNKFSHLVTPRIDEPPENSEETEHEAEELADQPSQGTRLSDLVKKVANYYHVGGFN